MSRNQRAGEVVSGPPPASSGRYHRSSIRSQKGPGLGSSSTRVQVVGERGYDSEIPRELGGMASASAGYHTEGQASTTTKRASKELLRNIVDPRRNGRLSSMPSQHAYPHDYSHIRPEILDDPADRGSSTRRVRREKEKDRRHHEPDPVPVPPSVWLNQLNASEAKRARRTSGSRTRQEDTQQHDPRAYPPGSFPPNQEHHRHPHYQSPPYGYAHHQSNPPHRNGNPAPTRDYYRPDDLAPEYIPGTPQANNPRYAFVIDDRAGMHSPPPVEIPHPIQSPSLTTPAAPLLPLPRSKEELLRSEGLPPQGSPFTGHRRHRPGRSEDFGSSAFADATNHARTSLRHRPSHSEDLRKLGQGHPPEAEEHPQLARPVHVGRSASENVVPQVPAAQPQLATPGMYNTGLAVTPAAPRGAFAMHPQLQESFAESANASRAPVNAAMASAAIANGGTDSDSTRGERERKRRTRRSKQVDAPTEGVSAAELQALQMAKVPTPPPTIQPLKRQRTVSGRSITAQPIPPPPPAIPAEAEREKDEDMVLYQRTPDPATVDSARSPQAPVTSPSIQARADIFRTPGEPLPQGLAMFGSRPEMTSSAITPAGVRTEMTQVPGPRADLTNDISRGVETLRAAGEVAPVPALLPAARRGSLLDEERTRKYSAATEGGASASGSGSRRPSGATDEQRRPVVRAEDQPHRRPSPNHAIVATAPRKSIASDASGDSFQSAQLGGSTTMDFQSARDAMSMRDAMSPASNYHSIAPSVKSELRDPRLAVSANEGRNPDSQSGSKITTGSAREGHRSIEAKRASGTLPIGHAAVASPPPVATVAFPLTAHANVISPPPALANVISPSISKERVLSRAAPVPATPVTASKPVEPEAPTRPRVPSNNMLGSSSPDVPGQRATVDAHVPPPPPIPPVDEEGRIRGPPPVASTMPARTNRASLTPRPAPQQTATPVTSPPQAHAQTQPEASAVPKNLQQSQQVEGSKESLPETLNSTKASKSKSSKWWKSSSNPKAPSPTPTPAPPGTSQPRQRNTSMLGFLSGSSKHKAQKPSESGPALPPQPQSQPQPNGNEMYNSYESTPSSTTLDHDQDQPKEKESRMARMVTAIKGGLRRTPSTSKMGHFPSKSMSRLPGTSTAPVGAPLARSASTNGREGVFASMFPMSPQRSKEPALKPVTAPAPVPPVEPPVIPPVPAPVPSSAPTPTPAPAMTVPISVVTSPSAPAAVPTPKPRPAEAALEKRPATKEVPIIEKTRVPISGGAPPSTANKASRPVDPTSRTEKRSSAQPPPQRPNSPPLVSRPVAPSRLPPGQNKIFNDPPSRAAPVPNTPHAPSRTLSHRAGRISSRDRVPSAPAAPSNQLRSTRSRDPAPAPAHPVDPSPPGDLGLPTPDATPRASPTGEDVFEGRAAALQEERERRQSQERRRHRPDHLVIPPNNYGAPNMDELNQRLHAGVDAHGVIKFDHREKRAVSVASVEAVSGQEGHFRSETSSIRTSTPGPHQITFPNRDPAEATQSWAIHQTEEDIRAGTSTSRRSGRDGRKVSGVLKHSRGGVRKPGVAFDFPSGPIIEADEDPQEVRQQADIHLTYELERRQKRYK
ncbi:Mucin-5AC [Rhizoctonia solani]|uniref:Mucin-5AC n=1 Tax=Rhizoctonia solani TaxID=456999 RepID=A0A0K6G1T5_9AGAM|nr:Mucin-5AC [Rhizoctonia solani]